MPDLREMSYGEAICDAFEYLLANHDNVFAIGQGLWSPWYVGNSMTGLEKKFGPQRIIDSPVSELATTGAAVGASLCGYRPVVIHPRMDFMLLAVDQIVNQAAKWTHMLGGRVSPSVTVRAIINRGGEQGAQHSQSLHAWFAHIPGLRVVMPATAEDARDLLIASVLCNDPVVYIDDRWLYERTAALPPAGDRQLQGEGPTARRSGGDITLVAAGYSTYLCEQAADVLAAEGVEAEVIDLRVVNPLDATPILESVEKTGRLCAVDGGWRTSGVAGEVLALVAESLSPGALRARPVRITLPDAPAPTSRVLERIYYPDVRAITEAARSIVAGGVHGQ